MKTIIQNKVVWSFRQLRGSLIG